MKRKLALLAIILLTFVIVVLPVAAQTLDEQNSTSMARGALAAVAIGMGIAAAGCGLAQSNAIRGCAEGLARNPGAADNIRLFLFLGLALIEFLALLTFVVCYIIIP